MATILEKEDANSLKLERPDKYLVYYQNNKTYFEKALAVAENLRKKELIVELEIGKREYEKVLNYARSRGIKYILIIDDDQSGKIKRIEVISEKEEIINL